MPPLCVTCTLTHTPGVMERGVSGLSVMGYLLQRGLSLWGRWDVWPWGTHSLWRWALTCPHIMDQHITDIFGRVRLGALMYELPFTCLQPVRTDRHVTLKWHECTKDQNTAPPQNNCGKVVMMTSVLTAPEGGHSSLYFQTVHNGQQRAFALLPPIPAIDEDRARFLLLFSKF